MGLRFGDVGRALQRENLATISWGEPDQGRTLGGEAMAGG